MHPRGVTGTDLQPIILHEILLGIVHDVQGAVGLKLFVAELVAKVLLKVLEAVGSVHEKRRRRCRRRGGFEVGATPAFAADALGLVLGGNSKENNLARVSV